MKYQGHEIKIIRQVGRNAIIKRKDGGDFETCSMLRHHGGKGVKTDRLMVSLSSIEGFQERSLANSVKWFEQYL